MDRRSLSLIALLLFTAATTLLLFPREPSDETPAPPAPEPQAPLEVERLPDPERLTELGPLLEICHRQHAAALGLPAQPTLVFTLAVDPSASIRQARVARVRVKNEAEVYADIPTAFEACAEQSLMELVFMAPGGRDQIDVPIAMKLGEASGLE